ncbi:acyltransferase [Acinetobacter soli]|uniref:acyltransferase family protein n=1 Tax=Acinetobacter soli TaxID=487316 RepID=UPI00300C2724
MRKDWVDYAKAIGIALVVFGHVLRGLHDSGIYLSEGFFKTLDSIIYSFHMPLFFFLAGLFFVSSLQKRGKKEFLLSKVDTIVYPYIIWSVIQGGISILFARFTNNPFTIKDISLIFFEPIGQFWFLYALFMIFIFITLIYNKKYFFKTLPFLVLLSTFIYLYQNKFGELFHINYITNNLVYFLLGILFVNIDISLNKKLSNVISISCITLFVLSEFILHSHLNMTYRDTSVLTFLVSLLGISSIVIISLILSNIKIIWIKRIGELSMIIYLLHIICGSGIRVILSKILGIQNWHLHVIAGTILGIIIPIIVYSISKKIRTNFLFEPPKILSAQNAYKKIC